MAKHKIQLQDLNDLYKELYQENIAFTNLRIYKKGIIGFRKIYAIAFVRQQEIVPENEITSEHICSNAKYFMVPIVRKKLSKQGFLFDIRSIDAHIAYINNKGQRDEVWRTTEVFLQIMHNSSELANIRSSGTGDTPYIDVTNNVQLQIWLDRKIPVYDFVIASGLQDDGKEYMNDSDLKKRKSIIHKFAREFFKTYILTKEDIKAEQKRAKLQMRLEAQKRKAESDEARRAALAEKQAWKEQRAAAKVRIYLDDEASQSKKDLMKKLVGEEIFED